MAKEKRSKRKKSEGRHAPHEDPTQSVPDASAQAGVDNGSAGPHNSAEGAAVDNHTVDSTNARLHYGVTGDGNESAANNGNVIDSDSKSGKAGVPPMGTVEAEVAGPASPATPPASPRTLTRVQALAELRRNGPAALHGATIASKPGAVVSVVDLEDAQDHRPTDGIADNAASFRSRASSQSSRRDNNDELEMEVRAFPLPEQDSHSTRAHRHRRRSSSKRGTNPSGDEETGSSYGANKMYKDPMGNDGEVSREERNDGGEEVSASLNYDSRKRAVVILPSATPSAAARVAAGKTDGGSYTPEEPNSLPRMLRLQRTFETNMGKLYSFCATHVAEWPALALEWIPDRKFEDPERDYTLQYVAIGTQTIKGAPNQVRVMEVAVPDNLDAEAMYGLYGDDDIGSADVSAFDDAQEDIDPGKLFKNVKGHFRCEQAITLDSTVLKIRAMPAETNIIAVTTASGYVGVFNLVQDQKEDEDGISVADAILTGHTMGGFGLCWNGLKPGLLASGADDGYVNYWDVKHHITIDLNDEAAYTGGIGADGGARLPDRAGRECEPLQKLPGHRDTITDVSWHASQGHLLASAGLDGDVRIWDIRTNASSIIMTRAHVGGATAAQFHPVGAFQLATAGTGGELCFWDIRRPKEALLELSYHGRAVTGLQWSPFSETVLGSFGEDGRVVVWDLGKTALPLEYSAEALAPPEVSFVHIGHLGVVTDFSWCTGKRDDWLIASADSFNGVHVYKPKESVVRDYVPRELW